MVEEGLGVLIQHQVSKVVLGAGEDIVLLFLIEDSELR